MSFNLRAWRVWCGFDQAELARLVGVSVMALSELEHGRTVPRGSTLQRLAQAFGVPRSVLLHETPEQAWERGWRPPEHETVSVGVRDVEQQPA